MKKIYGIKSSLIVVIITMLCCVVAHSQQVKTPKSKVHAKKGKGQNLSKNPIDKSIKICQRPCKNEKKQDLDILKMNINKI